MDIKSLATQLILSKIGGANDSGAASSALDDLVGGSGGFDLGDIVAKFTGSGGDLAEKAKSWLGDGGNEAVSADQIQDAIGSDKIEAFAKKLGIGREEASSGLSTRAAKVATCWTQSAVFQAWLAWLRSSSSNSSFVSDDFTIARAQGWRR